MSPFGQYAPVVAAITAVGLIFGYVVAVLLAPETDAASRLEPLVLLAVGAIFGSAVVANGYKAPLAAVHSRVDRLAAAVTSVAAQAKDVDAHQVEAILDEPPSTTAGAA